MRTLAAFVFIGSFLPSLAFAQTLDTRTALILNAYSLVSAAIIGLTASLLVFFDSQKMKGGVFGKALSSFALGMFFILLGFISQALTQVFPMYDTLGLSLNDVFYIVGYVFMAVGAHRIYQTIQKSK